MSHHPFTAVFKRFSAKSHLDIAENAQLLKIHKKTRSKGTIKTYLQPKPSAPRTAMGDYIVPPGGKPLTNLGDSNPGPATYDPPNMDAVRDCAPQYSICGLPKKRRNLKSPGPANYNTARNLVWNKCRSYTLKSRWTPKDTGGAPSGVGPATYQPKGNRTGENGPFYSMRGKDAVIGLMPQKFLQPPDVKGFKTPGPDYLPAEDREGLGCSFGVLPNMASSEQSPGPAAYAVELPRNGPHWSVTEKRPHIEKDYNVPAPNIYNIGTTIGKGLAKSMLGHRIKLVPPEGASPTTYFVKRELKKNGAIMTYRPFEKKDEETPGPADYSVEPTALDGPERKKKVTFTCRENCCPTFPDYPVDIRESIKSSEMPGPEKYSNLKPFDKNSGPAYTFGQRFGKKTEETPGPGQYTAKESDPGRAYSITGRIDPPLTSEKDNPSPSSYLPKAPKGHQGFTFASRIEPKGPVWSGPGPNSYNVVTTDNSKKCGTTLKGRHSPWVYFGIDVKKVM